MHKRQWYRRPATLAPRSSRRSTPASSHLPSPVCAGQRVGTAGGDVAGREGEGSGGPGGSGGSDGRYAEHRPPAAGRWNRASPPMPHVHAISGQPCMRTTARMTCSRVGPSAAALCLQQQVGSSSGGGGSRASVVGPDWAAGSPARCRSLRPACCRLWQGRGGVACPHKRCRFRWVPLLATLGGSGHGPIGVQGGSRGLPGGPGAAVHRSALNLRPLHQAGLPSPPAAPPLPFTFPDADGPVQERSGTPVHGQAPRFAIPVGNMRGGERLCLSPVQAPQEPNIEVKWRDGKATGCSHCHGMPGRAPSSPPSEQHPSFLFFFVSLQSGQLSPCSPCRASIASIARPSIAEASRGTQALGLLPCPAGRRQRCPASHCLAAGAKL